MLQVTGRGAHHSSQSRELTESEKRKREHADLFRSQQPLPAGLMNEGDPTGMMPMPNLKKPSNVSNGSEVLAQINAISNPKVAENLLRDSQEQLKTLQ